MLRALAASTLIVCLCGVTAGCGSNNNPGAQAKTAGYNTDERPKPEQKKDAPGRGDGVGDGPKPGNPDGSPPSDDS